MDDEQETTFERQMGKNWKQLGDKRKKIGNNRETGGKLIVGESWKLWKTIAKQ